MSLKFKTNIVFPGSPRTELSKIEMYFLLMVSSSSKSPGQFNSCAHCLVETPLWMQLIIFLRFVSIYWIQTNRKRYPTIHSVRGLDGNWERNIFECWQYTVSRFQTFFSSFKQLYCDFVGIFKWEYDFGRTSLYLYAFRTHFKLGLCVYLTVVEYFCTFFKYIHGY